MLSRVKNSIEWSELLTRNPKVTSEEAASGGPQAPTVVHRPGTPHRQSDTTATPHYISKCSVVSHHEKVVWCGCGVGVVCPVFGRRLTLVGHHCRVAGATFLQYVTLRRSIPPSQNLPLTVTGIWTSSNILFLWPTRPTNPNSISVESAVLSAEFTVVTNGQTDRTRLRNSACVNNRFAS